MRCQSQDLLAKITWRLTRHTIFHNVEERGKTLFTHCPADIGVVAASRHIMASANEADILPRQTHIQYVHGRRGTGAPANSAQTCTLTFELHDCFEIDLLGEQTAYLNNEDDF